MTRFELLMIQVCLSVSILATLQLFDKIPALHSLPPVQAREAPAACAPMQRGPYLYGRIKEETWI